MLHITNGDIAADLIRQTGLGGTVLAWRDVLHEGPVPAGLSLSELSTVRASFIAAKGWESLEKARSGFRARDSQLEKAVEHPETVLWFEHDLYDQLQLLQILDWFEKAQHPGQVQAIFTDSYLGHMQPAALLDWFKARQPVSQAQFSSAGRYWSAFRAPFPLPLQTLIDEDEGSLPHMKAAMLRHLEQFPSTDNGLSRSEQALLDSLFQESLELKELFTTSQQQEEASFLGDTVFALHVEALSQSQAPLLLDETGGRISAPRGEADAAAFWKRRAVLTEQGRKVRSGEEDHVRLNGVDRWLGGVHLQGKSVGWRWDRRTRKLKAQA